MIQLKLMDVLHHSTTSPTCSYLDRCRCFLTFLPALSLPFSSFSFLQLQSNLLKYRYDHITLLSSKPFRGSALPMGTDKLSITHMKPLMIWLPALQSYRLQDLFVVPPVVPKAKCCVTLLSLLYSEPSRGVKNFFVFLVISSLTLSTVKPPTRLFPISLSSTSNLSPVYCHGRVNHYFVGLLYN